MPVFLLRFYTRHQPRHADQTTVLLPKLRHGYNVDMSICRDAAIIGRLETTKVHNTLQQIDTFYPYKKNKKYKQVSFLFFQGMVKKIMQKIN